MTIESFMDKEGRLTPSLDADETDRLIVTLGAVRGEKGFSSEDVAVLLNWADDAKHNYQLFLAVLRGACLVNVKDGDVVFSLTEEGKRIAKWWEEQHV